MRRFMKRLARGSVFCLAGILVLTICGGWAIGDVILGGTDINLEVNGFRSSPSTAGLTGYGNYDGSEGKVFTIRWVIAFDQNSLLYHYEYTFSGTAFGEDGESNAISHFTLDISDDAIKRNHEGDWVLVPGVIINPRLKRGDGDPTVIESVQIKAGDPLEFIASAVKFDIGGEPAPYVYEFDSERPPVWGSFLVKNGGGPLPKDELTEGGSTYVVNNALVYLQDPDYETKYREELSDPTNWIAVPNSSDEGIVPEPTSFLVWLGIAAIGWGAIRRR